MQRYFFHVRDGHTSLDETGFECADMDEVRAEALRTAGALLKELGPNFWKHRTWTMWVTDEAGEVVLTLNFSAGKEGARGAG